MPRKTPGPPCVICSEPSVAKQMCDKHYRRFKEHGDAFKTKRPGDWGKRNKHPLNEAWRWTTRVKEGRVERWNDMYAFIEDVGERPDGDWQLRRLNPRKPWGPDNFYWQQRASRPEEADDREWKALQQRIWRDRNPIKSKSYDLKRHFGLTVKQYADMLVSQRGVCAICAREDKHRSLAVDHCHATGKVRGLLCTPCNRSLGAFGDNIDRLKSAIAYLETHHGHST